LKPETFLHALIPLDAEALRYASQLGLSTLPIPYRTLLRVQRIYLTGPQCVCFCSYPVRYETYNRSIGGASVEAFPAFRPLPSVA